MTKYTFRDILAEILLRHGFKKKGGMWYFLKGENVCALELQKSNYGDSYYLNLCCLPHEITVTGVPFIPEQTFPIRIRASAFYPDMAEEISVLLNLESNELNDEERAKKLSDLFENWIVPEIICMSNSNNLIRLFKENRFLGGAVRKEVYSILNLEMP